jgi:hypothetical protein
MSDMIDQMKGAKQPLDVASEWGIPVELAVCERCDWSYVVPRDILPQQCPRCFQENLTLLHSDQMMDKDYIGRPELILPFGVSSEKIAKGILTFAGGHWFAPGDLKPQTLQVRLKRLYLPMWLVDANVKANWQAEAGFDYEVVSHQDQYQDSSGGWTSREVKETRIRWEPRLGRLNRSYTNVAAPALEEHTKIMASLGRYSLSEVRSWSSEELGQGFICLPNRSTKDAWPDAVPLVQAAASEECRQASNADHMREFRWSPDYDKLNWTLLLLPVFTSYYLDDDKNPCVIMIHGQTGRLYGARRASMKRAQRTSIWLLVISALIFIASLLGVAVSTLMPPMLVVGGVGLLVALMVSLTAIIPPIMVWQVNRTSRGLGLLRS